MFYFLDTFLNYLIVQIEILRIVYTYMRMNVCMLYYVDLSEWDKCLLTIFAKESAKQDVFLCSYTFLYWLPKYIREESDMDPSQVKSGSKFIFCYSNRNFQSKSKSCERANIFNKFGQL